LGSDSSFTRSGIDWIVKPTAKATDATLIKDSGEQIGYFEFSLTADMPLTDKDFAVSVIQ